MFHKGRRLLPKFIFSIRFLVLLRKKAGGVDEVRVTFRLGVGM